MTSRDFCYWLQGYLEISGINANAGGLKPDQLVCIQKHLNLVFKHEIDPSFGDDQEELNKIHNQHLWNQPNAGDTLIKC